MNFEKWRHYLRARVLEIVGRHDLAMSGYRDALAADSRFRRAANSLAYRCAQSGDDAGAIESFGRVLALGPRDATAHFNLAYVYAKSGRQREAIGHFRSAVEINTSLDRAWYGLGLAHAALGEHREAMEALEQAAALQPMAAPIWYQYGMASHHARDPERVRKIILHVNRFDPRTARQLIVDAERADLAYLTRDMVV